MVLLLGYSKNYWGFQGYSPFHHETVGIQDPVSSMGKVIDERLQHAFTEAVLDQLAANGTDVKRHCRKLREQQNVALINF